MCKNMCKKKILYYKEFLYNLNFQCPIVPFFYLKARCHEIGYAKLRDRKSVV